MKPVRAYIAKEVLSISFNGVLDISQLEIIKETIIKKLEKPSNKAKVSIKSYERLDMAFIQLLIMLFKHFKKSGKSIETHLNFKEDDLDMLQKLGLLNVLNNYKNTI
ncbi:MAG: hypothetical protein AAF363_07095 [Bacteroidota bacterium]